MNAPADRAREIAAHHHDRLARTEAALGAQPRRAYDVSLDLFPGDLSWPLRRFATAESLAHLEWLAREGRAVKDGTAYVRARSAVGTPAA